MKGQEDDRESFRKKQPSSIEDDIYIFGNIEDGDCFDDSDVEIWRNGCFEKKLEQ